MNKQNLLHEVALFRFSLIAPVINNTHNNNTKIQYFKDVASKYHQFPNGTMVKFTVATLQKWYLSYNKYGFDSLIPKSRSDIGKPRVLDDIAISHIHTMREKYPHITGKLIYKKLIEQGYIKASEVSLSSILRYLKNNNLKRADVNITERKAFEMEFANDCWQSDTSHGPIILVDGKKTQTYLITFIDDASRLILHGEFFYNDNAINMQITFKKAISKYGVPKKIFLDNGTPYKNEQIRLICASLGIILIHAKPYSPESKGKIERSFRTIKDNWMNGIDWNTFNALEQLNDELNNYLNESYTNVIHSSINDTPRKRYLKDMDKVKYINPDELSEHFLHRVTRRVLQDSTIQLHNKNFEVPQKYIGQKINIRYSPIELEVAYIYSGNNELKETVYPLKKVDNSKIKRKVYVDYSKIRGDESDV